MQAHFATPPYDAALLCDCLPLAWCLIGHQLTILWPIAELMMEDPDDSVNSYEAGIFARLEGVKAVYDPNNLFRDLRYVHPKLQAPTGILNGDIYDALPFSAAEAMAPAPVNAVSGAEAPHPMQG